MRQGSRGSLGIRPQVQRARSASNLLAGGSAGASDEDAAGIAGEHSPSGADTASPDTLAARLARGSLSPELATRAGRQSLKLGAPLGIVEGIPEHPGLQQARLVSISSDNTQLRI